MFPINANNTLLFNCKFITPVSKMKKDIENIDDIKLLVNAFYDKIRSNDLLGPVFNHVIKDKWPEHLEKMVRFWQTILLYEHTYSGTPFPPHAKLPIQKIHFETWVALFQNTVDDLFSGEKANMAKSRAIILGITFSSKMEQLQASQINTDDKHD
jgi:hemoglobin